MKYQPAAVSVVCTVCSDQPATRYPSGISVNASQRLENHSRTSQLRSSTTTPASAVAPIYPPTLQTLRLLDAPPNGTQAWRSRALSPLAMRIASAERRAMSSAMVRSRHDGGGQPLVPSSAPGRRRRATYVDGRGAHMARVVAHGARRNRRLARRRSLRARAAPCRLVALRDPRTRLRRTRDRSARLRRAPSARARAGTGPRPARAAELPARAGVHRWWRRAGADHRRARRLAAVEPITRSG